MIKRAGESPTRQESIIINMWEERKMSIFQIANQLILETDTVYRTVQYWCQDAKLEIVTQEKQKPKKLTAPEDKTTMAKKDKNAKERAEMMAKLREGEVKYGVEMDKIRGLLPELDDGECYIIQKQSYGKDKVNIRLGDVAI